MAGGSDKRGYNTRLFESGGLRAFFHNSRFIWLQGVLARLDITQASVFELGCFDGRLLDYLGFDPSTYNGFDADWEGGLSAAQRRFSDPTKQFVKSMDPADLNLVADGSAQLSASMETLEHIPPELLPAYLDQIARITNGYFLVTVPNEKGPVFLGKYLAKKIIFGGAETYRFSEVLNATLGRMHKVSRTEHKGFDHKVLTAEIAERMDIVAVEAIPFKWCPVWAGFTIGIIAKTRARQF